MKTIRIQCLIILFLLRWIIHLSTLYYHVTKCNHFLCKWAKEPEERKTNERDRRINYPFTVLRICTHFDLIMPTLHKKYAWNEIIKTFLTFHADGVRPIEFECEILENGQNGEETEKAKWNFFHFISIFRVYLIVSKCLRFQSRI